MNILLIEPDKILGQLYSEFLKDYGYSVVWERGAQAAVSAADAKTPDVVVLELLIPSHNGLEFLYEFRSYPEWQTVPVVVHSLLPTSVLGRNTATELGVTGYLYKPHTSLAKLEEHIRRAVLMAQPS